MRGLFWAAVAEAATLVVLLLNLATVHHDVVSSLIGPLHGTAYLVTIGATLLLPVSGTARLLAVVPGVGGALALRRIRREEGDAPADGVGA